MHKRDASLSVTPTCGFRSRDYAVTKTPHTLVPTGSIAFRFNFMNWGNEVSLSALGSPKQTIAGVDAVGYSHMLSYQITR